MDIREVIVNHLRNYVPDPRNDEELNYNRHQLYREEYVTYTDDTIKILNSDNKSFLSIYDIEDEEGKTYRYGKDFVVSTEIDKFFIVFIDLFESSKPKLNTELLIKFKEVDIGRQWIFPAKQSGVLNEEDYPAISVSIISDPGSRLGNYEAPMSRQTQFEVNVRTKDHPVFKYTEAVSNLPRRINGEQLGTEIIEHCIKSISEYEEKLHPTLYGFVLNEGGTYTEFEENTQSHRRHTSFSLWRVTK